MKQLQTRLGLSVSLLIAVVCAGATRVSAEPAAWAIDPGRLGLIKPLTDLCGKPVNDPKSRTLGKLEDVAVDLPSGRALFTFVAAGSAVVAVPTEIFNPLARGKLAVNADKAVFATAPRSAKALLDMAAFEASCRHFRQAAPGTAADLRSGTNLLGVRLLGEAQEPLGVIKDIMIDLPCGKVVYLVVAGTGVQEELFVVPPVSVRRAADGSLTLPMDLRRFAAGPRFPREYWSQMAFPELAASVNEYYQLRAAVRPATAERAVVASEHSVTAVAARNAPPASRPDAEITDAVVREIMRCDNGFMKLDVNVVTRKGIVTVSGLVRNQGQKKQVIEAVGRVVGPGNVEDRLELRGKSKAKTASL